MIYLICFFLLLATAVTPPPHAHPEPIQVNLEELQSKIKNAVEKAFAKRQGSIHAIGEIGTARISIADDFYM
jgi:hypothetical protein